MASSSAALPRARPGVSRLPSPVARPRLGLARARPRAVPRAITAAGASSPPPRRNHAADDAAPRAFAPVELPTAARRLAASRGGALPPCPRAPPPAPPPATPSALRRARRERRREAFLASIGSMTEEDATKKTLAEMAAMVPGGAEALLKRAARLSRHREEGASSDFPAAVEGETRRRNSRRVADLEDGDDESSDDDASADALLEVAIELALVAAALADRDANDARVSLAACAEAARVDDGFDAAAAARASSSPRDRSRSPALSSSTPSLPPPCCDAESSSALELDLERSIALHSASTALAASLRRRLGRRAIADEWAARTAATASVDFRRDRAKPRVRAKDRRCHAPKARQGWTRAAIRSERVRTCVGCDRLAEGDRMIRIARLERKEDGNDEEDGAEESGAEESRRGPAARKNVDDREGDEGAGVVTSKKAAAVSVTSKTKKGKSRRRDSHTSGGSGGGRVLAVDASSGRLPPRLLKAMIGPEGPLSALTRAHPDARSLAAEMVSSATASERRRGGARLHGRGMYVCPRVHCATRAAKAKALRRHLPREKKDRRKSGAGGGGERGGGGGPREGDSSSSASAAAASAAAASFGEALVRLCAELEAIEGVDSSGWVVTREGGAPSRWTAPPRFSDAETGAEAEEAGAFASK